MTNIEIDFFAYRPFCCGALKSRDIAYPGPCLWGTKNIAGGRKDQTPWADRGPQPESPGADDGGTSGLWQLIWVMPGMPGREVVTCFCTCFCIYWDGSRCPLLTSLQGQVILTSGCDIPHFGEIPIQRWWCKSQLVCSHNIILNDPRLS